ncbi:MAG: aldo/keto reductase [Thermomicrobia bacterium]|nr:aldo/keto reductase [Thermomicrobia bacterium]
MSTIVAFGGAAIGKVTQDVADAAIQNARDHGVNHFDVAPTYGDAELRLAPWMPQMRADIFLGCKTTERSRDGAKRSIHASLERLGVDAFDLFQFHSVGTMEKLDQCLGKGGAIEAVLEARDEGLLKYIGITGHGLDAPQVHAEGLRRFPFDTVMFPLNFVLYTNVPDYRRDYEALISLCQVEDVGVHIIKTLAKSPWYDRAHPPTKPWYEPFDDQETIDRAVAFNAAQPIHTLCASADVTVLPKMLDAAERYRSVSPDALAALTATAPAYEHVFATGSIPW